MCSSVALFTGCSYTEILIMNNNDNEKSVIECLGEEDAEDLYKTHEKQKYFAGTFDCSGFKL